MYFRASSDEVEVPYSQQTTLLLLLLYMAHETIVVLLLLPLSLLIVVVEVVVVGDGFGVVVDVGVGVGVVAGGARCLSTESPTSFNVFMVYFTPDALSTAGATSNRFAYARARRGLIASRIGFRHPRSAWLGPQLRTRANYLTSHPLRAHACVV